MSVYLEPGWRPLATLDETESEPEVRDAVYGFVRALQPRLVVETGSYKGAMTEALGRAVLNNRFGQVVSCEPNVEFAKAATARCWELPVLIHALPSQMLSEVETADFLFLDSDYKYRADEIARAKRGATIVIHDAYKSYDPNIGPLAPLIESLGGVCFRCGIEGRGFGILVKK